MYHDYCTMAGRIRHLLPLHVSVAVFYKKFPLYVGIDAMRRFTSIQQSDYKPVLWTFVERIDMGNAWRISWRDHHNRCIDWDMPKLLPNGKNDDYYSWFWIENEKHPFHVSDLIPEQKVYVRPSTFDYEVLDSTTRRYDIRVGETGFRPHLFCGNNGPRPYPLEFLADWDRIIKETLLRSEPHQVSRLINLLGSLHENWKGCEEKVFRDQIRDYLSLCLNNTSTSLIDMATSGALFDIFEWHHFISKK